MREEWIKQINEFMGEPDAIVFTGEGLTDVAISLIYHAVKAAYHNGKSEGLKEAQETFVGSLENAFGVKQ